MLLIGHMEWAELCQQGPACPRAPFKSLDPLSTRPFIFLRQCYGMPAGGFLRSDGGCAPGVWCLFGNTAQHGQIRSSLHHAAIEANKTRLLRRTQDTTPSVPDFHRDGPVCWVSNLTALRRAIRQSFPSLSALSPPTPRCPNRPLCFLVCFRQSATRMQRKKNQRRIEPWPFTEKSGRSHTHTSQHRAGETAIPRLGTPCHEVRLHARNIVPSLRCDPGPPPSKVPG
jgi:hypothetical protein